MSIETRCRRCGRIYTADRTAILAGPAVWRLCPDCRHPNPPGGVAVGAPDVHIGTGGLTPEAT